MRRLRHCCSGQPSFTPNGKRIVFEPGAELRARTGAVHVRARRQQPHPVDAVQQRSGDQARLVAGRQAPADGRQRELLPKGDSANIATIRPNGTGFRLLTNYQGGDVNAFAGSYSPDGKSVVFRLEDHGSYALERMHADGSHVKPILPLSSFRPRNIDWGPSKKH